MSNIVVLSGGMDSATILGLLAAQFIPSHDIYALAFDYRQRHRKELEAAKALARHYHIPLRIEPLPMLHGSALINPTVEVPEGSYDDESMAATVVHGRNLLFASVAVAFAQPDDEVWFGVHAGDHAIYADCRPDFWQPLDDLVRHAYRVTLRTPWLSLTKGQIAARGKLWGVPYHLTWSCYKGGEKHCGRCGTCVERAEALDGFDPTDYEDPSFWREAVSA